MKRRLGALALLSVLIFAVQSFAASKPYTFAVIGDNKNGYDIYSGLVAKMMRMEPDLVVNVGDVIVNPGDRKQWDRFWELSRPIKVPYYLAPGNHDIDDEKSQQVWRDEVKLPGRETYYSFVKNNDLFVVINTCEPDNYRRIAGAQLAWLKGVLASDKYDHKFVFLHHPLYLWAEAKHHGDSLDRYPEERDELHELFRSSGVDIVFEGHEHTYRRMKRDGILYVVTGGGGARLYSGFNHFIVLEVDGDVISAKVTDKDGAVRDRFTMGLVPKAMKATGTDG